MAITALATNNATDSTLTAVAVLTCAWNGNVTAGNLLVVGAANNSNASTSISDTLGNVWTKARSVASNPFTDLYWATANASGANTVTVHWGGSDKSALNVAEFSGVALLSPVDVVASAHAFAATVTVTTATTTQTTDLAVNFVAAFTTPTAFTTPSGWTPLSVRINASASAAGTCTAMYYQILAAKGTVSAIDAVTGAANDSGTIVTFKPFLPAPNPPCRQAVNRSNIY